MHPVTLSPHFKDTEELTDADEWHPLLLHDHEGSVDVLNLLHTQSWVLVGPDGRGRGERQREGAEGRGRWEGQREGAEGRGRVMDRVNGRSGRGRRTAGEGVAGTDKEKRWYSYQWSYIRR